MTDGEQLHTADDRKPGLHAVRLPVLEEMLGLHPVFGLDAQGEACGLNPDLSPVAAVAEMAAAGGPAEMAFAPQQLVPIAAADLALRVS